MVSSESIDRLACYNTSMYWSSQCSVYYYNIKSLRYHIHQIDNSGIFILFGITISGSQKFSTSAQNIVFHQVPDHLDHVKMNSGCHLYGIITPKEALKVKNKRWAIHIFWIVNSVSFDTDSCTSTKMITLNLFIVLDTNGFITIMSNSNFTLLENSPPDISCENITQRKELELVECEVGYFLVS